MMEHLNHISFHVPVADIRENMPRYTLSTVIQKALYGALEDRKAMLDSLQGNSDTTKVLKTIEDIRALHNLEFDKMTPEQVKTSRLALIYAEQWNEGLADSMHCKGKYGKKAVKDADMFRTYRIHHFGLTKLETMMGNCETIVFGAKGWEWKKTGEPYKLK
jgi:hypothetical protein